MEEIRQVYDIVSNNTDYFTTFLRVASGLLFAGGIFCLGYSAKLVYDIKKRVKSLEENKSGLEEKLE